MYVVNVFHEWWGIYVPPSLKSEKTFEEKMRFIEKILEEEKSWSNIKQLQIC